MMKEAIYEAAVAVLTEHGAVGITMERVAEEAGVAKGSLYNYFPNKLALLRFVHERAVTPLKEKADQIARSDLSAMAKLQAMIRHWFTSIDEQRGVFNFLFMDLGIRQLLEYEEASGRELAVDLLANVIEQGVDEGAFRECDYRRTGRLFYGALREICDARLAADADWPVEQVANEVIDFFMQGVSARGKQSDGQS
jgi:AcrR family transcriptional regulator